MLTSFLFRDFANIDNIRFAIEEDHEYLREILDFAHKTKNPLMLQLFEKWAGPSGYILEGVSLQKYQQLKREVLNDEGKCISPLLIFFRIA